MNKPVAFMNPTGLEYKQSSKDFMYNDSLYNPKLNWIPLYTHPVKYCPSENNEAYEKGFIDGMAKQRDSAVQRMVEANNHPVKELTDEEIQEVWIKAMQDEPKVNAGKPPILKHQPFVFFAKAILRKAQEK